MKYFNNPKTKAELTEQYRELLIKYNYKSSKSKATINEITNEYNQLAKEIDKKINGPSAFDIIKDGIKLYYNKKDMREKARKARADYLNNKKYTKNDIDILLDREKMYIKDSLNKIVKKQGSEYLTLSENILANVESNMIYDLFCDVDRTIHTQEERVEFIRTKEELEYCIFNISRRNEKNAEKTLENIESNLGKYITNTFNTFTTKVNIDPIIDLKSMKGAKKIKRDNIIVRFFSVPFKDQKKYNFYGFLIFLCFFAYGLCVLVNGGGGFFLYKTIFMYLIFEFFFIISYMFQKHFYKVEIRRKRCYTAAAQKKRDDNYLVFKLFLGNIIRMFRH